MILPASAPAWGKAQTLRLAGIETNPVSDVVRRKLKRAYQRIGVQVRIYSLPRQRALVAADRGEFDGVVARTAAAANAYKNLLIVPTPVLYVPIRAYGRPESRRISSLSDLRSLRIGITLGTPYLKEKIVGLNYRQANTPLQLLQMLKAGRVDVALITQPLAEAAIKKGNISGVTAISNRLFRVPVYHLLNRRHRALLPLINKAIAAENFTR